MAGIKYLVLATRTPDYDPGVAQPHRDYLDELLEQGLLVESGRYTDSTGGAYVIRADDLATARELAHADPLYTTGSAELVVHEWEITVTA